MSGPYGLDLRKKGLALIKKGMIKRKTAAMLDIGESTLFSVDKKNKRRKRIKGI